MGPLAWTPADFFLTLARAARIQGLITRRHCMDAWVQPSAPFAGAGAHSDI